MNRGEEMGHRLFETSSEQYCINFWLGSIKVYSFIFRNKENRNNKTKEKRDEEEEISLVNWSELELTKFYLGFIRDPTTLDIKLGWTYYETFENGWSNKFVYLYHLSHISCLPYDIMFNLEFQSGFHVNF